MEDLAGHHLILLIKIITITFQWDLNLNNLPQIKNNNITISIIKNRKNKIIIHLIWDLN